MKEPKKQSNPVGRPEKYRPEYCQDIIDFFSRQLYIKKKLKKWVDGKEEEHEVEEPNTTPYFIDWCMKIGVCQATMLSWTREYPEFLKAYTKCKALQERFISEHGLQGNFNAFMSFCALKNVSGWRDKQEVEATVSRGTHEQFKNMTDEEILAKVKGM